MHIATLHKCSLATNFTQTLKCKMWFLVQYIFHKLFFHKIVVNHEYLQKHKYHDETRQLYTFCPLVWHLLPLYTKTKSNSEAPPCKYVGNFDYLLQHSTIITIWHIMWKHDVHKTEVHALSSEEDQATTTVNVYRKFREVQTIVFKMHKDT